MRTTHPVMGFPDDHDELVELVEPGARAGLRRGPRP